MDVFTIGYEDRAAREFFTTLRENGIRRLLDVRRNNVTEAGRLSNGPDCAYLLGALLDVEYLHDPYLGPTTEMLAELRGGGTWDAYEMAFRALIAERKIEERLDRASFEAPTVLLCAERGPEHCHRRLVVEHLQSHWPDVHPVHL